MALNPQLWSKSANAQMNWLKLFHFFRTVFKESLGPQTQVSGLDLVLPNLLCPQIGVFPVLLGSGGLMLDLDVLGLAQLVKGVVDHGYDFREVLL